ncbi:hypothetical protein [Streptomyces sp. NPDC057854]|uniref:hypothetical protein n=1 Tax=unclassified Streptomyces TaxID=2593676 RepID=UPI00367ED18F
MRFVRSHAVRVLAAGLLAATALPLAAAGPAAAADVVVEPFGQRYQKESDAPAGLAFPVPVPEPRVTGTASPRTVRPAPAPSAPAPAPSPPAPMAATGRGGERLWLLGALAVVLAGTGLVARAAMRGRGD